MIKVLLADDQAMIRGALSALLSLEGDIDVVAEVGTGDAVIPALDRAFGGCDGADGHDGAGANESASSYESTGAHESTRGTGVDVAILDIEMPGCSGIEAAKLVHEKYPQVKCLVLTTFGRPGYMRRALDAGALGFMVKETPARELATAIRRLNQGERVIDPSLAAAALVEGANPLSERERELLRLTLSGDRISDIARRVFLSEGTVRNHLSAAMAKTHTETRMQAALLAEDNGWL
ncbi:response regulator transcription factor [Arcanobacterium bovis]|uniref:Response regulator transcription factor n=1 Tax=Arcanobacterium bovis TaxID=2529275 RepID=A0A4Q9V2B7_9ACTO|nr:response regulator transcription factor [Arcanobacterium bovis]TBW23766.1 response regulator transcription factor [Arcanobacterium bovis]